MRPLFFTFILGFAGISAIHAQQKDSLNIFPNRTIELELKTQNDSLQIFPNRMIMSGLVRQDDSMKIYPNQFLKLELEKPVFPDKSKLKLNLQQPDYNFDRYLKQTEGFRIYFGDNKRKYRNRTFNLDAAYSRFIVPTALISYGVIARNSSALKDFDRNIHYEVSRSFERTVSIDDYMQYAPMVAVFGFDLAGVKAKHNFRDRAFVAATSYILMDAVVHQMKNRIDVGRPDGSNNRSFPSGHTATAFVGAHILFREYKDSSPWLSISGYAVAAATGACRILNKRHWFSDVATGAGVGILSAEIGYLLLPVFHKIFGIKDPGKALVIAPTISSNKYGVGLAYTF